MTFREKYIEAGFFAGYIDGTGMSRTELRDRREWEGLKQRPSKVLRYAWPFLIPNTRAVGPWRKRVIARWIAGVTNRHNGPSNSTIHQGADMPDAFAGLATPAGHAAAVTPNDSADLTVPARGLYIGGAGDVSIDTPNGETAVVFAGLAAGTILPVRVKRVRSTSTDATNIVALW